MRKTLAVLGTGLGLLLCQPASSSAQTPDATIELSGGSAAAGIGYTWGNGVLIYQGKRYPLKIDGVSLASLGVAEYTASGSVTGLRRPEDIDGIYTAVSASGTVGVGGGVTAMQNQNGVTIRMAGMTKGLNLTLAAEGAKISIAN
jgi:hypothetical protein